MIDVRKFLRWICIFAGTLLGSAPAVLAQPQPPVFSAASGWPLPGSAPGDALPIVALADVGAYPSGGPPDGKLDIVTALQGPMTAVVLFGKGDGTFPSDNGGTPLDRIPTAMVIDDIDQVEGKDLVVADTGSVAFMHGSNDGAFDPSDPTPPHNAQDRANWVCVGHSCAAPVGAQVVALAVADVDGNGKMDVVAVDNVGQGGVMVLLGDGSGNLTPGSPIPAAGSWAVAVGDFNKDGAVDLAVTNRNNNPAPAVTIFHGNGHGAFTLAQTLPLGMDGDPVAIASADLNGDGRPDLVVANQNADNLAVFVAQADNSFQAAQFFSSGTKSSGPNGVALVDVSGDGKRDAVVSNGASSDVSILLGDGTGRFGSPRAFVAHQEPLAVAAADLNNDGAADVVAITQDGQTPSAMVLRGNGDGSFAAVENVIVPPNPKMAVAGDVDNDGLADLIVVPTTQSGGAGILLVYRALAAGGFAPPVTLQSHADVLSAGAGDFNGDGVLDVVALNGLTQDVSLFLGSPTGLPGTPANVQVGTGAAALAVGDWDGNGLPDLAILRRSGNLGAIDVLVSAGGTFQGKPSIPLTFAPQAIDLGDFNNDGKLDLAVANGGSSAFSVLRGAGDGTFAAPTAVTIPGVLSSPIGVAAADFDGDGTDDVAVLLAGSDNKALVFYGPNFAGSPTGPLLQGDPPSALIARDLNGDLVPDLLVTNQGLSNAVVPYRFTRAPSKVFTKAPLVTVGRMPIGLTTGDFDGDGRYDAATADNQFAGTVSVLTNIAATPAIIRGDGNGDGKLSAADLVTVARQVGKSSSTRVERLAGAAYPNTTAGADANGDAVVTGQDIFAIAYRLFPRL
ncbi:MAG: VCBS repeat-containing protein [Candidatus Binatia bacterium]